MDIAILFFLHLTDHIINFDKNLVLIQVIKFVTFVVTYEKKNHSHSLLNYRVSAEGTHIVISLVMTLQQPIIFEKEHAIFTFVLFPFKKITASVGIQK